MTTQISDLEGTRAISLEATNAGLPGSVFLMGPEGWCMEFDRATFMEAVRVEFGLVDPLEAMLLV